MTDHLDRKRCKKLKDWGMDQELKEGEFYWAKNYSGEWCRMFFNSTKPSWKYFKIHSLDELLEFARGLDDEWQLEPADNQWGICKYFGYEWWWVKDKNPKLAVYKLIEKLKEVEA